MHMSDTSLIAMCITRVMNPQAAVNFIATNRNVAGVAVRIDVAERLGLRAQGSDQNVEQLQAAAKHFSNLT
jgi:hypothetical protein